MNNNLSTSGNVTANDLELSDVFTGHIILSEGVVNVLYKARRKGQWFVLKALRPEFRDDLVRRELLAREFKLGRRMDHPNIVRFFSLENDQVAGDCIVMEYVDGVSLADYLKTKPSMAARKRVARQLLETMRHFHGLQIIHRDLKPDNILITRNGNNVKIIDFGLADSDDSAVLKQPVGSPKYMSPEQQAGETLDCRSDLYALGAILREMMPAGAIFWRGAARRCTRADRNTRPNTADDMLSGIRRRKIVLASVLLLLLLSVLAIFWMRSHRADAEEILKARFRAGEFDGRPCLDAPTVTDIDGNTYTTIQLGCQCWMRENLRTTHYADGTSVPIDTSKCSDYEPYLYYPNYDKRNVPVYGYLYNWSAVMGKESPSDANPSGVQGICPDGWHVPSMLEFHELESHVSSIDRYVYGNDESYIGKALADTSNWDDSSSIEPNLNNSPGYDQTSNNATGFSALPAGDVFGGEENYFHQSAYFWTSTEYDSFQAPYRFVDHDRPFFGIWSSNYKRIGRSVRCVKNM